MAITSSLTDNFNNGSTIDASKWTTFGSTPTQGNGVLTCQSTISSTTFTGVQSNTTNYDLTGNFCQIQITDAGNQSIASFEAVMNLTLDANNSLAWYINANFIHAQKQVANVYSDVKGDVAYNSAVHKWFRIRESAGTLYWDYSTDTSSWTNYTTLANPFAVTAFQIKIMAGTYSAEGSTTTASFDNLNLFPYNKPHYYSKQGFQ